MTFLIRTLLSSSSGLGNYWISVISNGPTNFVDIKESTSGLIYCAGSIPFNTGGLYPSPLAYLTTLNSDGTLNSAFSFASGGVGGGTLYAFQRIVLASSTNILGVMGTADSGQKTALISIDMPTAVLNYQTQLGDSLFESTSSARSIATDSSGNIYICGRDYEYYPTTDDSAFIYKYDSSGAPVDYNTFGSIGFTDYTSAQDIAVDPSSHVYVTGQSDRVGFVAKFNAIGSPPAFQKFITPTAGIAYGVAIAVDSSGNSYVAALLNPAYPSLEYSTLLCKFDSSGTIVWQRQLTQSPTSGNSPADIALDSSGDPYLLINYSNSQLSGESGIAIVKYDSSGSLIWQTQITSSQIVTNGPFPITSVSTAANVVTYHYTVGTVPASAAGWTFLASGFLTAGFNGTFTILSSTNTTIDVSSPVTGPSSIGTVLFNVPVVLTASKMMIDSSGYMFISGNNGQGSPIAIRLDIFNSVLGTFNYYNFAPATLIDSAGTATFPGMSYVASIAPTVSMSGISDGVSQTPTATIIAI